MNKKIHKKIDLAKVAQLVVLLLSAKASYGMERVDIPRAEFMSPNNRWRFPAEKFMDSNRKLEQPPAINVGEDFDWFGQPPSDISDRAEENLGGNYYLIAPQGAGKNSIRITRPVMRSWQVATDIDRKIAEGQKAVEEKEQLEKEKRELEQKLAAVEQQQQAVRERRGVKRKEKAPIADKAFKCKHEGCSRSFAQEGWLYRHEEIDHAQSDTHLVIADQLSAAQNNPAQQHVSRRPFKCRYGGCSRSFGYSESWYMHEQEHERRNAVSAAAALPLAAPLSSEQAALDPAGQHYSVDRLDAMCAKIKCRYCPQDFYYDQTLQIHEIVEHGIDIPRVRV